MMEHTCKVRLIDQHMFKQAACYREGYLMYRYSEIQHLFHRNNIWPQVNDCIQARTECRNHDQAWAPSTLRRLQVILGFVDLCCHVRGTASVRMVQEHDSLVRLTYLVRRSRRGYTQNESGLSSRHLRFEATSVIRRSAEQRRPSRSRSLGHFSEASVDGSTGKRCHGDAQSCDNQGGHFCLLTMNPK